MRMLLGSGLLLAAVVACGGRIESVAGAGGAGGQPGQVPAVGGAFGTGGLPATGGSGGTVMPPYGLVRFDDANDITATACAGKLFEPEPVRVALELAVDVSSSMNGFPPNSTSGQTKWEITRDGLIDALDRLPARVELGMTFFPNRTTPPNFTETPLADHSLCVDTSANLPITQLGAMTSQARANIINGLNAITVPTDAGTPTEDAYAIALGALQGALPTVKYLLLVTDGLPTYSLGCLGYGVEQYPVDLEPLIGNIGDAYSGGQIKTIVMGLPGTETSGTWLSVAAAAGGTADWQPGCSSSGSPFAYCHFDLTTADDFGQALGAALRAIADRIAPCEYSITPPVGTALDPTLVNVIYTDADSIKYGVVSNQTAGDCEVGWRYSDTTATKLELCGETCRYIRQDPFGKIGVLFGCRVIAG
jgi:hypothetical protein